MSDVKRKFPTRDFVAGELTGEYHDASMCTFDGSDCAVASISCGRKLLDALACRTPEEARRWLFAEMRLRTGLEPKEVGVSK